MRLNLSNVQFSKKDIKLGIKVPRYLTPELAYLIGVHIGDGTLVFQPKKWHYIIGYTGHLIDEYTFHKHIIIPLIKELFNKDVTIVEDKRENKNSVRTYFKSKAIFTFLSSTISLPVGPKINCRVPEIISKSNNEIKISFLRGLADTDFTLTFKKRYRKLHYYPAISLFSKSELLIRDVSDLLAALGFKLYIGFNKTNYDKRTEKYYKGAYLDLNGVDNLSLWMNQIGFNSEKHLTKYQVWKKFGYCPPYTNINQRIEMLNRKGL